jgi:hypothetical protein
MPTPAIIERVKQVQAELGDTMPSPTAAPAVNTIKQALDTIMLDPTQVTHYKGLGDKLLFHYVGFQIDHPKLAKSMEDLANSLAAAGI